MESSQTPAVLIAIAVAGLLSAVAPGADSAAGITNGPNDLGGPGAPQPRRLMGN